MSSERETKEHPPEELTDLRQRLAELQMLEEDTQEKAALTESEERYRKLVELSPDGVAIQSEGKFVFMNASGARILGADLPEQVIGKPIWDFVHPEYREIVRERIRTEMETGMAVPLREMKMLRLDGAEVSVETTAVPFTYGGKPATQVWIRDVTRRKAIEDKLTSSESRYRQLVELSPDAIVVHSGGKIIFLNPTAAKMVGAGSPEEMLGKPIWNFVHPKDQRVAAERIKTIIEKKKAVPFIEETFFRLDGTSFVAEVASTVFIQDGKLAVQTCIRDLTERRKAEEKLRHAMERLEQSNKELELFTSALSHDLREPLRAIMSFTGLLEKSHGGKRDSRSREFSEIITRAAARMNDMINDLVEYTRLGTRGKAFEPCDGKAALEQALSNLKIAIEESGAEVTYDPLPTVTGDISQLSRLFQNLISNAIKFRREEPARIRISAQRKETDWVFSVRDNGIGIPREHFDKLFLVFSRLHSRSEYEGTGIGLAICKKIVERHGGHIWVDSEQGKGSTFYFSLPVADRRSS